MFNLEPSFDSFSQPVSREDLDKIAEACLNLQSLSFLSETQTNVPRISWEDYYSIFIRLFKDGAQFLERSYQQTLIKRLISEENKAYTSWRSANDKEINA